jgi:hypothetical protein
MRYRAIHSFRMTDGDRMNIKLLPALPRPLESGIVRAARIRS